MQFIPELALFLKEHKFIYTIRKFRYSLQDHHVEVEEVGKYSRSRIATIFAKEDLLPYVLNSGFATAADWWHKAQELNKGYYGPYYLYEVTVEEGEENV